MSIRLTVSISANPAGREQLLKVLHADVEGSRAEPDNRKRYFLAPSGAEGTPSATKLLCLHHEHIRVRTLVLFQVQRRHSVAVAAALYDSCVAVNRSRQKL